MALIRTGGAAAKKVASVSAFIEGSSPYMWSIDNNGVAFQQTQDINYTGFFSIPRNPSAPSTRTLTANVNLTIYKGNRSYSDRTDTIHVSAGDTYQITVSEDTFLIVED